MIIIYHNNRCSKSRLCLDLIKKSNADYKVIEYLKENLSVNNIKEIVYGLEGDINDIVRTNEKEIKNVKINFKNKDSIIKLVAKYNICMQRPIIRVNEKFVLRRDFKIKKDQKVLIIEDVITTGKSSQECAKLVDQSDAELIGFGCIIDRSRNKSVLKKNIISQIELDIPVYSQDNLPKELSAIKAVKPGSRNL